MSSAFKSFPKRACRTAGVQFIGFSLRSNFQPRLCTLCQVIPLHLVMDNPSMFDWFILRHVLAHQCQCKTTQPNPKQVNTLQKHQKHIIIRLFVLKMTDNMIVFTVNANLSINASLYALLNFMSRKRQTFYIGLQKQNMYAAKQFSFSYIFN